MMVIRSNNSRPAVPVPGAPSGTVVTPALGCGRIHTSMLDWQDCVACRNLPMYEAYARSPRFVPPPDPPKVEEDKA